MHALHSLLRFTGAAVAVLTLTFSGAVFAQDAAPMSKAPSADMLDFLDGDHVLGDPKAPVKVIEYASLSCPHCMEYHLETFPQLKEQYIDTGKVAFIYRHFPFNDPALRGAMLAECSGEGNFYKYINVLMKAQDKWAYDSNYMGALRNIAKIGGMGEEEFDACMENKEVENRVVAGMTWASDSLNIRSTPTTFVNGEKLQGFQRIEDLAKHIDPLVKDTAKTSAE